MRTIDCEYLDVGHERLGDLDRVCRYMNRRQTAFRFSRMPVDAETQHRADGIELNAAGYLDVRQVYDQLQNARRATRGFHHLLIAATSLPLAGEQYNNLFSGVQEDEGGGLTGLSVVTTNAVAQLIPGIPIALYLIHQLMSISIRYAYGQPMLHDEPQVCIFHRRIRKPLIRDSILAARLCDACHERLLEKFERDQLASVRAVLNDLERVANDADPETACNRLMSDPIGSESDARGDGKPSKTRNAAAETRVVLSWVHLSDIHFGAGAASHRFDQAIVAQQLLFDLTNFPFAVPSYVFVTGDIAFSGAAAEYEKAVAWLEKVAAVLKVSKQVLRFVPGNHDVDRKRATDSLLRALQDDARRHPKRLDDHLSSDDARALLGSKLAAYTDFVVENFPAHPKDPSTLDWIERILVDGGGSVRLAGLCSVWTSDAKDGLHIDRDEDEPLVFVPNLLVAKRQTAMLLHEIEPQELLLVLTHHPTEWLNEECRRHVRGVLAKRPHIHFCGHVHGARAQAMSDMGEGSWLRYVAGAAHRDPKETPEHGYAWGAIRWNGDRNQWESGWSPRTFVVDRNEFRADRTQFDLGEDEFAWKRIELAWQPPK